MKSIKTIVICVALGLVLCGDVMEVKSCVGAAGVTEPVPTRTASPMANERWVYQTINGRQCKRLRDTSNGIWLTDWILCADGIGDVTEDGRVNAVDALEVLKHSAGMIKLQGTPQKCADLNGDDVINAMDALGILYMAVM